MYIRDESDRQEGNIAFLLIESISNLPLPKGIPLSQRVSQEGDYVALIGIPYVELQSASKPEVKEVFKDIYNAKRLQPGQVLEAKGVRIFHDASTSGNGGSVLLDLMDENTPAIGMQFAAVPGSSGGEQNLAVSAAYINTLLAMALKNGTQAQPVPIAQAPSKAPPR